MCRDSVYKRRKWFNSRQASMSAYKYVEPGPDGCPWERCSITRFPKSHPVSLQDAPGLFENVGHGFSVYVLGRIPVDREKANTVAKTMATMLPVGTPRGTIVQLVQITEPHLPASVDRVPTVAMVVWGRGATDPKTSVKRYVVQEIEKTQKLAEDLEDGEELDPEDVFTYGDLLKSSLLRSSVQAAQGYRGRLAARMLRDSGLEVDPSLFTPDGTQLNCLVEAATCDVYAHEDDVVLLGDYNRPNSSCGCVYNGPSRGAVLYLAPKNKNGAVHPGGPVSGKCSVFEALTGVHDQEQFDAEVTRLVKDLCIADGIADCVHLGGRHKNTTYLRSYAMSDEYMSCPDWATFNGLAGYTILHCRCVASILPSPVSDGLLYGRIPLDIPTLMQHRDPGVDHVMVPNTAEHREALVHMAEKKEGFTLMNGDTAVYSECGEHITHWRVPCDRVRL